MFGGERRQLLLDLVRTRGAVSIRDLAAELGASHATVRRDVTTLANRGLILHTHGGAMTTAVEASDDRPTKQDRAATGTMFGAERRRLIAEVVRVRQVVSLRELAEAVNATEATVRRDLVALEKRGMVLRSHGGASIPDALNLTPWPQLSGIAAAKASIGSLTATMVGEGEAIMLGAGTTVQAFARSLAPTSPLTVLTHSILVARELAATPNVELVMTGGSLDGSAHALVGKAAETWISEHRVSRAYLSGTSLTLDRGLQGTNPALSAVARAIVQSARSVTVLADRSKFGAEGRFDVAPTARIDELVTDGTTDDRIVESLAAGGVKVHVTPPHSALAS